MLGFRTLIISPSGNLYGSEQVLLDYLASSGLRVDVAVPADSILYKTLLSRNNGHRVRPYRLNKLKNFYAGLWFDLARGRYRSVYLNEAGHVKYILLLARFFPGKKFIIHVRLLEDAARSRWFMKPRKNVSVISISHYLSAQLPVPSQVIYDAFTFTNKPCGDVEAEKKILTVGVIGRITMTKGLSRLLDLLQLIRERNLSNNYRFLLYGAISEDAIKSNFEKELLSFEYAKICGFESSTEKIYRSVDCVMHFSTQEALGRIYLESIDNCKPFIGLQAAGIGEIARLLSMEEYMADPSGDIATQLLDRLEKVRLDYNSQVAKLATVKPQAEKLFNQVLYTQSLDKMLSS